MIPNRQPKAHSSHIVSETATLVVFASFLTAAGLGLNYFFNVAIARWFGPEDFGLYTTGIAIMNALAAVVVMGLDAVVLREVAAQRARGDLPRAWNVMRHALIIVLIAASFAACALVVFAKTLAGQFFRTASGIDDILAWFALALPPVATLTVLLAGLQAIQNVHLRLTLRYGFEPICRFGIGAIAYLLGTTIVGAIWAIIAAGIATAMAAFVAVRRMMVSGATGRERATPSSPLWSGLLRASLPLTIASILTVIASRADIVILLKLTDAHQVGLYGGAFVTAAIITILLQVVETIVAPMLADGIARHGPSGVASLYQLGLRWVTLMAVPVFLIFVIAADWIMGLLGPDFNEATLCFIVLAAGHLANALTGSAGYVLVLAGRVKLVLLNALAYSIVFVILTYIAISHWGIIGAASAMLFATMLLNALRIIEVYLLFKILPFSAASIGPALIGAAILIAYAWLSTLATRIPSWAYVVLAGLCYSLAVVLTCLHPDDRTILKKALRISWRR